MRNNLVGVAYGPDHARQSGRHGLTPYGAVLYSPFLAARPNFNDHPPVVRVDRAYPYIESGQKMLLTLDCERRGRHHDAAHGCSSEASGSQPQIIADTARAASLEVTVPLVPGSNGRCFLRVEAFDARGQSGWDQVTFSVPYLEDWTDGVVFGRRAVGHRPDAR